MNLLYFIVINFITTFIGFSIGRIGDKYGGNFNAPHHWLYGFVLIIIGIIYFHHQLGLLALSFGIGHFISDLNDFWHLRIWGKDKPHQWKFWSIK